MLVAQVADLSFGRESTDSDAGLVPHGGGDLYGSTQPEHEAWSGLCMTISYQAVATSAERLQQVVGDQLLFDLPASVEHGFGESRVPAGLDARPAQWCDMRVNRDGA